MVLKIVMTLFIINFSLLTRGSTCVDDLRKINLRASKIRQRKTSFDFKLSRAGSILTDRNQLANLNDGQYVFLITRNGDVIYTESYHIKKKTVKVGAHISLYRELSFQYMIDKLDIISAGEFGILNGQGVYLTNKSSSFPGEEEALKIAQKNLEYYGLSFHEDFVKVDYSIPEKFISDEEYDIRNIFDRIHHKLPGKVWRMRKALQNKEAMAQFERIKKIHRDIVLKNPKEGMPYFANELTVDGKVNLEYLYFVRFFNSINPLEGLHDFFEYHKRARKKDKHKSFDTILTEFEEGTIKKALERE